MLYLAAFFGLMHVWEDFRNFIYRTWYVAGCTGFMGAAGYVAYIMYYQFYDPKIIEGMFLSGVNDLRILVLIPFLGCLVAIIIVNGILKAVLGTIFNDLRDF